MKSLNTWLVSSVGFYMFVAASPVSADVSDTFILINNNEALETKTLTEADEGTGGAGTNFAALFPKGTHFVGPALMGDEAIFVDVGNGSQIVVKSDANSGGGEDSGEAIALSIVGKNGKPSPVAQTLLIGSDKPPPSVPEPGTIGLFCAGIIGLWFKMRAKRG